MKKLKKYWFHFLVSLIVLLLIIPKTRNWIFSLFKGKTSSGSGDSPKNTAVMTAATSYKTVEEGEIAAVFKALVGRYPKEFVQELERMFRLETAHFKSGQWKATLTPGMVAVKSTYPYGWSSLQEYANSEGLNPSAFGVVPFSSVGKDYISFPSVQHSVEFTAWFLMNKRGGNIAAWNALDPAVQAGYSQKLKGITARFV